MFHRVLRLCFSELRPLPDLTSHRSREFRQGTAQFVNCDAFNVALFMITLLEAGRLDRIIRAVIPFHYTAVKSQNTVKPNPLCRLPVREVSGKSA